MSMLSDHKLLSGRTGLVGQSLSKESPSSLDPKVFEGALVRGDDQLMHYSDGERWIGVAPVLSTLFDAGNAATTYTGGAKLDLGSAQS